ncbi:GNAT family N-acetyltransferase [Ktedonobacter robiniae]|uniref:N-acetyltransferase n=1 Tax=Ktedonobacter robiniae TaxID=2778365 RepID=A0ABQ3UV56_9CHLR|nr:GNAT family N-acetyltransferase [Ktedonobacter robiniae]GHO56574.1 N-acetyltransferase [Ktedonobacter robiniae]
MSETIRKASADDVPRMLDLAEQRRQEYAHYQPVFWKPATDAREKQSAWFAQLVRRENIVTLVYERDGEVIGFVIANFVPSPPVYDVPGLTCNVDDFCVATHEDWLHYGRKLLEAVMEEAKQRGAAQIVVVCAHLDHAKRSMLSDAGLTIASEWYTTPL